MEYHQGVRKKLNEHPERISKESCHLCPFVRALVKYSTNGRDGKERTEWNKKAIDYDGKQVAASTWDAEHLLRWLMAHSTLKKKRKKDENK